MCVRLRKEPEKSHFAFQIVTNKTAMIKWKICQISGKQGTEQSNFVKSHLNESCMVVMSTFYSFFHVLHKMLLFLRKSNYVMFAKIW